MSLYFARDEFFCLFRQEWACFVCSAWDEYVLFVLPRMSLFCQWWVCFARDEFVLFVLPGMSLFCLFCQGWVCFARNELVVCLFCQGWVCFARSEFVLFVLPGMSLFVLPGMSLLFVCFTRDEFVFELLCPPADPRPILATCLGADISARWDSFCTIDPIGEPYKFWKLCQVCIDHDTLVSPG